WSTASSTRSSKGRSTCLRSGPRVESVVPDPRNGAVRGRREMTEFNPSLIGGTAPSAPQSRYVLPSYVERTSYGVKEMNPYNKLFEERIIFVGVQIDDVSANDLMAQLITLEQL